MRSLCTLSTTNLCKKCSRFNLLQLILETFLADWKYLLFVSLVQFCLHGFIFNLFILKIFRYILCNELFKISNFLLHLLYCRITDDSESSDNSINLRQDEIVKVKSIILWDRSWIYFTLSGRLSFNSFVVFSEIIFVVENNSSSLFFSVL